MKKVSRCFQLFAACSALVCVNASDREGIVPTGKDGQPLNLGFETGTLKDWSDTGTAFEGQPVRGDTVSKRRGDMKSDHDGQYWVGTYERLGDDAQGVLTSVPFAVTQPFGSFLVAGGTSENTRVELVDADTKKAFFKIGGTESENLRPVVVDLKDEQGKKIFIRVVDQQGGGWGHINFDDFRLHAQRPKFANELDPAKLAADAPPPMDNVKYAGLTPQEAADDATVPDGFKLKLFAGEPDVKQPIAFAIDDRGRLWVAEAYTYPVRAAEGKGKDRILIFEDTDGDGKFDKRTVFIEHLNLVSGMAVGFGGVWVGAAPYFMFIPDRNHDDKPDGPPEIVLDGWAYQDTHETLNTFTWGPDGWLYGCQGVFTFSDVGKPGAPKSERTPINAAVWRFHPQKKQFEIFAEGTSNPWGIDFDAHGQCWIEACVIPHLYHMIQGARYQRQAGEHFNKNVYDDIKTVADHVHYAGTKGPHAGNGRSDAAGGGHAHAGMMVYLGGSYPEKYNGMLFMNNIHGQRINMDIPEAKGSGFVGHHGADFVNFNDRWSQILNMLYDQDGSVYMIDWYDKNQCHHTNIEGHDRSNGRIFKLVYGDTKFTPIDLDKKSSEELLPLLHTKNEFYARHARRILQERGPDAKVKGLLRTALENADGDENAVGPLEDLWALHAVHGLDEQLGFTLLKKQNAYLRAWTIQLLCEDNIPTDEMLKEFATLAKNDPSPIVRLYLASALQRIGPRKADDANVTSLKWHILTALLGHGEDINDHNLPLVDWYAAEPMVARNPERAVKLLMETKIPRVREFIARRITTLDKAVASK
jgi:putative membrane-bound dehydrogenase-like protein